MKAAAVKIVETVTLEMTREEAARLQSLMVAYNSRYMSLGTDWKAFWKPGNFAYDIYTAIDEGINGQKAETPPA